MSLSTSAGAPARHCTSFPVKVSEYELAGVRAMANSLRMRCGPAGRDSGVVDHFRRSWIAGPGIWGGSAWGGLPRGCGVVRADRLRCWDVLRRRLALSALAGPAAVPGPMLIVSDVHAAFTELAAVAALGEPLLVLGDLLNFVDYRTGAGIAADVYGRDHALEFIRNRKKGDWEANRRLWHRSSAGRLQELAVRTRDSVLRQYASAREALTGSEAYVTFGNVDWPEEMRASLSGTVRMVDGEVVEIEGYSVGFAGGGVPTPANARGEVSHEAMAAKLEALGEVDILCTHVPPSVAPLHRDVVTGVLERSSPVLLDYLLTYQPPFHYFGDVHQPQAYSWRVGRTLCRNVGYFRATARAVRHE